MLAEVLMKITSLKDENKKEVESIVASSWGDSTMAVHGELYDLCKLPCLVATSDNNDLLGYCYYRISGDECEIMAMEAIQHNRGVGTALINTVLKEAENKNLKRVYLQTTNDNFKAFRFYQRRGFTMCNVRFNELNKSRMLKPAIPLIGTDNIPLLHEIEFEIKLDKN